MFGNLDRNRFSFTKKKSNIHHFLPSITGSSSTSPQGRPIGPHLLRSRNRNGGRDDEMSSANVSEVAAQFNQQQGTSIRLDFNTKTSLKREVQQQQEEEPEITERTQDLTEETSDPQHDFTQDESPRVTNHEKQQQQHEEENDVDDKSAAFGNVKLVSPTYFDEEPQNEEQQDDDDDKPEAPASSPLASMVHALDLAMFDSQQEDELNKKDSSTRKVIRRDEDATSLSSASILSCPAVAATSSTTTAVVVDQESSPTSVLVSLEEDDFPLEPDETTPRSSKLARSFRSRRDRVAYQLRKGRKGMSPEERKQSKTYLPTRPNLSLITDDPTLIRVLLVEPMQKLFEVVVVDTTEETTVGEVLAKARVSATDAALSDQKYVSLCNQQQELAAPMLEVHLLLTNDYDNDNDDEDYDYYSNKTTVLAAVPEGYTAGEIRYIQNMLINNPRMKRWLQQDDPFTPKKRNSRRSPQRQTFLV